MLRRRDARRRPCPRPATRRPPWRSAVFLQTRMKTGGRGSSRRPAHSRRSSSHSPPSIAIGVMRPLEDRLGLRAALPAAALGRRQLRQDPAPDVEVAGNLGARSCRARRAAESSPGPTRWRRSAPKSLTTHGNGRFVSWPTRPRKYGVADRSTQKLIPRSLWMRSSPSIQTVASLKNSSASSSSPNRSSSVRVRLLAPDAVGVVRLVVEDQDVLLAARPRGPARG